MARIGKPTPGKKRLLPPSKTQFAWAMERRENAKTYFKTLAVEWDPLGPNRAKIEAAAAAEALVAAAAAQAVVADGASVPPKPEAEVRSTMLTPTPTRRMVRPPSHLVFRTKIVTRTPKPK
jgi:hypothetical protein